MKTSYLTHYEKTILNSLDLEAYDIDTSEMSEYDQIKETYKIFLKEKGHDIKRIGERKAFTDWLQGLPSVLTVPFSNYEILQNALMDGMDVSTEDKEDDFLNLYWGKLTDAFFTLKDNF